MRAKQSAAVITDVADVLEQSIEKAIDVEPYRFEDDVRTLLTNSTKEAIGKTWLGERDPKADQAFKAANHNYALALMGDVVSEEHLEKELAILERLDTRITRATKMLMQAKAVKEIMGAGSNNKAKIHAVGHSAEGCKLK